MFFFMETYCFKDKLRNNISSFNNVDIQNKKLCQWYVYFYVYVVILCFLTVHTMFASMRLSIIPGFIPIPVILLAKK